MALRFVALTAKHANPASGTVMNEYKKSVFLS